MNSVRGRPRTFDESQLIETAMKTFWKHGYDQVSMDMLCEITKLTKPSFYNVFGTKEKLFLACLHRYHQKYAVPLLKHLLDEADPLAGFKNLMTAAEKQFFNPKLPSGCLVLTGAIEAKGKSKTIDKELLKIQTQMLSQMETYFGEKVRNSSHSAYALGQFVLSQLYAMAMFSRTSPQLLKPSEFIKAAQTSLANLLGQ